jgi:hypothetical protein
METFARIHDSESPFDSCPGCFRCTILECIDRLWECQSHSVKEEYTQFLEENPWLWYFGDDFYRLIGEVPGSGFGRRCSLA